MAKLSKSFAFSLAQSVEIQPFVRVTLESVPQDEYQNKLESPFLARIVAENAFGQVVVACEKGFVGWIEPSSCELLNFVRGTLSIN